MSESADLLSQTTILNWLQVLGPTLLMLLGGGVTWLLKSRVEELRAIEKKLREERRNIYSQILEPYIRILSDIKNKSGAMEAQKEILSFKYRKTSFELNLFGSDDVIIAYNSFRLSS